MCVVCCRRQERQTALWLMPERCSSLDRAVRARARLARARSHYDRQPAGGNLLPDTETYARRAAGASSSCGWHGAGSALTAIWAATLAATVRQSRKAFIRAGSSANGNTGIGQVWHTRAGAGLRCAGRRAGLRRFHLPSCEGMCWTSGRPRIKIEYSSQTRITRDNHERLDR